MIATDYASVRLRKGSLLRSEVARRDTVDRFILGGLEGNQVVGCLVVVNAVAVEEHAAIGKLV